MKNLTKQRFFLIARVQTHTIQTDNVHNNIANSPLRFFFIIWVKSTKHLED